MSMLDKFSSWKEFLANRVKQAKDSGMDEETLKNIAHEIGDYLAENVEASNEETKLLQQLWTVADESEQQAIANVMVKYVQN
ncbi:MAG TPA: DUF3243 domain-containing protein [Bacillota bacterium]|nr:DUF3243 domain-containing protein [Bacillota bacterium]